MGDVRGELWTLEQALAAARPDRQLELVHRRNRILASHLIDWLGPLIAELDRTAPTPGAYTRELHTLRSNPGAWSQLVHVPRLFHKRDRQLLLGWRSGYIRAAAIHGADERASTLLDRLLACPAAALMSCLEFDYRFERHAHAAKLQTPERLARVRNLRLHCADEPTWSIHWLAVSAPHLRRLWVENPDASALVHPTLTHLRVSGQRADRVLGSLGYAQLPALRRLDIGSFHAISDDLHALTTLLRGDALPALSVVRVSPLEREIGEPLLDALARSRLVDRLSRIEFERAPRTVAGSDTLTDIRSWFPALSSHTLIEIREINEPFCAEL